MDFAEIKNQIKYVLEASQGVEPDDGYINYLVNKWWENKKEFYECFGEKLISESSCPLSFEVSASIKKENYNDFCEGISNIYCGNSDLINFLNAYNEDDFYQNNLSHDYIRENIHIKKGSKFLRSLKYFIPDKEALDKVQTHASQIIQEGKVTGILCFSIHPLDYLSSSENSYHWRSCHSLDGDFRAGNLAYMMDPTTIVCYIKSEHGDTYINNFGSLKWNTKKWRMLLFFSETRDVLFAGRQYPFAIDGILKKISNSSETFTIGSKNRPVKWCSWSSWSDFQLTELPNRYSLNQGYIYIEHKLYGIKDIIKHGGEYPPTYYNDLLYSTCYQPQYCYNIFSPLSKIQFTVGADVPCLTGCGSWLEDSNTFFCCDCGDHEDAKDGWYCECCGAFVDSDYTYWVGDVPLCPDCADEETMICDNCGERFFKEDITYCSETKDYRCRNCGGHFKEDI